MKALSIILCGVFTIGLSAADVPAAGFTMILRDKIVLRDCKVTSETADAIFVRHSTGMVKVMKSDLFGPMREQYPTRADILVAALKERHGHDREKIAKGEKPGVRVFETGSGTQIHRRWSLDYSGYGQYHFHGFSEIGSKTSFSPYLFFDAEEVEDLTAMFLKFEDWAAVCKTENAPALRRHLGKYRNEDVTFCSTGTNGYGLSVGREIFVEEDVGGFLTLLLEMQTITVEFDSNENQADVVRSKLR